jgi:hypothetical protein
MLSSEWGDESLVVNLESDDDPSMLLRKMLHEINSTAAEPVTLSDEEKIPNEGESGILSSFCRSAIAEFRSALSIERSDEKRGH